MTSPRDRRLLWLMPAVTALCATTVFLLPNPELLPMDDSYIHVVYGENLAHAGKLEFNVGEFAGIGSTSILWVLLIAGLVKLGIGGVLAVRVLGALALILATIATTRLIHRWVPRLLPRAPEELVWLTTFACSLSGNLIWFAMSGMETTLFLGLALLAIECYAAGRWWAVGLAVGLAALTRLEGGVLVVALLGVELIASRRCGFPWRRLFAPAAFLAALVTPWLLYLHERTGRWLPTSFGGKRAVQAAATADAVSRAGALAVLAQAKPLVFLALWAGYAVTWVWGLGYGYPPSVPVGQSIGGGGIDLWLPAAVLLLVAVVPLTLRGIGVVCRSRGLLADPAGRSFVAFLVWCGLHNAAYALSFPSLGTTSRYQAVNHVLLWLLPMLGAIGVRRPTLRALAVTVMALLLATNIIFWRGTYAANLRHMSGVRLAASEWIRDSAPGVRVAAFDIGALRWGSGRALTDLGGLVDADLEEHRKAGSIAGFLRDRHITHLAIPSAHSSEPAAFFDLLEFLTVRRDPRLAIREVARFECDYGLWRRGAGPTCNYMPAVVVYELEYR